MSKQNFHISEIPEFRENPVAEAFTTYVLGTYIGLKHAQAYFARCSIPFGAAEITYRMYLESSDGNTVEFFIIKKGDELGAMALRIFDADDKLLEDHLSFTHYQMAHVDIEGVLEILRSIPKQPRVEFYMCGCDNPDHKHVH